jgi:hypothetical protein
MRLSWVVFAVLLGACSGTPTQSLTSPCVDQPATGALGACPPCQTDADCKILSNPCDLTAYCVHNNSNWQVTASTCPDDKKYRPTPQSCRCLANRCDWHWNPAER